MIQIIIIISVIILLVGLMVKWPRPGLYIFKTACLMLLLIGLLFALFFTLMGLGEQRLNINLHPWREYVGPRFIGALVVTVIIFAISQIPLLFLKKLSSKGKTKVLKIEGLVYMALLIFGTGLLYMAVSDRNYYPENQVVDKIEDFHARHGLYPKTLSDVHVHMDNDSLFTDENVHLGYSCDKNAYTLCVGYEYGNYVYDSRKDRWNEIPEGSPIENYMIAIPKEADDVIISDYDNRRGDVGRDTHGEDGEVGKVLAVDEVEHAEHGNLGNLLGNVFDVHARGRNDRADAVDQEHDQRVDDFLSKIFHLPSIAESFKHVRSPLLSHHLPCFP